MTGVQTCALRSSNKDYFHSSKVAKVKDNSSTATRKVVTQGGVIAVDPRIEIERQWAAKGESEKIAREKRENLRQDRNDQLAADQAAAEKKALELDRAAREANRLAILEKERKEQALEAAERERS